MHGSERMLHITSTRSDLNFRGYVDLDRFSLNEHPKVAYYRQNKKTQRILPIYLEFEYLFICLVNTTKDVHRESSQI